jgi:hypothetical protein
MLKLSKNLSPYFVSIVACFVIILRAVAVESSETDEVQGLTTAVEIVYQETLTQFPSNLEIVKKHQLWLNEWWINKLSEKPQKNLPDLCEERLIELLDKSQVHSAFLQKLLNNPVQVNKAVAALAINALWRNTSHHENIYVILEDFIENSVFMPLEINKLLVALNTSSGAYTRSYDFFILEKQAADILMKKFLLPSPKSFELSFEDESNNSLSGNFNFIKKGDGWDIEYAERLSSWEGGNECTWHVTAQGIVDVIEESQNKSAQGDSESEM